MSARMSPASCCATRLIGVDLAQLGEHRDVEQSHGEFGLEAAEHPAGERVVVERVEEGLQQVLAPLLRLVGGEDQADALVDDAGRVFVDGGDEQRLLVREVDVRGGAAELAPRARSRRPTSRGSRRARTVRSRPAATRGACARPWSGCRSRQRCTRCVDAAGVLPPLRDASRPKCARVDEGPRDRAQRLVPKRHALGRRLDPLPRGPAR